MKCLAVVAVVLACLGPVVAEADDHAATVVAARQVRVERLTREDGWLSLVGLHFLPEGESTIGAAADNRVVLAAGPAHIGTVALASDGAVTFMPRDGVEVTVDGARAGAERVRIDRHEGRSPVVRAGTMSFFVIERGGRQALRVRDNASARRTQFAGIEYFPIDPDWRVEARWVAFDGPRNIAVKNIAGSVDDAPVSGKLIFEQAGRTLELTPFVDDEDGSLFIVFADTTSGESTYQMRFLYADALKDGRVTLDFNLALNPPCAFTPFATCPLPPEGNDLPVAVEAGEKQYQGSHD